MPDPGELRAQLAQAAEALERAEQKRSLAGLELAARTAAAEAARRTGAGRGEERERAQAAEAHAAAIAAEADARIHAGALKQSFVDAVSEPADLFGLVDAARVLTLLPVQIQTRFTADELLVRVYPDAVSSDTHEPELTPDEIEWGTQYWTVEGDANASATDRRLAWGVLAGRHGPRRAAWIARRLDPGLGGPPAPGRAARWTRAPRTRVLPDRWVVLGYVDGERVLTEFGGPIPDSVALGPDPTSDGSDLDPFLPQLDDEMRWLVDFAAAERVGMGIRIRLEPDTRAFERLLVLGLKASLDADRSRARLEELLDAHHYTDGLTLLPAGAPTNNTAEGGAAAFRDDALAERSYAVERGAPLVVAGDGSDGDRLARALGVDPSVLAHVANADRPGSADAAAAKAALWPAVWGYYLAHLYDGLEPAEEEAARRWFIRWVRADGPLAVLTLGSMPYGVLPVTALDRYTPLSSGDGRRPSLADAPDFSALLVPFLRRIRRAWRASLHNVPRIGRTGDVERDLIEVLGQEPSSGSYAARGVLGLHYWANLWSFFGWGAWSRWFRAFDAGARSALRRFKLPGNPRLARLLFWRAMELNGPRVVPGPHTHADEPLSETETLTDDYIGWLLASTPDQIRRELYPGGSPPNALLYLLLRHSLLLALANVGTSAAAAETDLRASLVAWHERELVGIDPDDRTPTIWQMLASPVGDERVPAETLARAIVEDALGLTLSTTAPLPTGPAADALREVALGLKHLEARPTAVLARALSDTLDLAAARLDAWVTSLATERLERLRRPEPAGVCLGAYGWVEGLRPRPGAPPAEMQRGDRVVKDPGNLGFVHAPSIAHATAAAVLRAGHQSHRAPGGADLALDLSSSRVRVALELLDGVREGQPLAALLGYRFERGLHERHAAALELDRFIVPFRQLAPLRAGKRDPTDTGAVEAIAARDVVDGLRLLDLWRGGSIRFGTGPLPTATSEQQAALDAELTRLADADDALRDALTAETVYQIVQGNPVRSGATLDAIATGEAPPPELEVVQTARSGVGVTHRLLVLWDDANLPPPIPSANVVGARSDAEPVLAAWAAAILGPAADISGRATFTWTAGGVERTATRELTLAQLGLEPIDLVYIARPAAEEQRTEIEQRLEYFARRNPPGGASADAPVTVDLQRAPALGPNQLSLAEAIEVARALGDFLGGARAIDVRDLVRVSDAPADWVTGTALTDLGDRGRRAEERLTSARDALAAPNADLDQRRNDILSAAALGIPGAVPLSATGVAPEDDQALAAQARSLRRELDRRLDAVVAARAALQAPPQPPDAARQLTFELARLEAALGGGFKILPRFVLPAAASTELAASFGRSQALQGGDESASATWFLRAARVRDGTARLESALLYGSALGRSALRFRVAQLPHSTSDRWVGLPPPAGARIEGGRLSLVAHLPETLDPQASFDPGRPVCGVIADEWVETVPNPRETTAVTFHFDAPGAEPPQAILLAVHPDPVGSQEMPTSGWDLETLEAILLETRELAELRLVDSDALEGAGQLLPALYLAANSDGDTVSTPIARNRVAAKAT
jgi:hypothetical protein